MSDPLRAIAERVLMANALFAAAFEFACAVALAGLAIWLWLSFDDWIGLVGPLVFGLFSVGVFVSCCDMYLSARPAQRPDERERYLRSRSLFNPDDPRRLRKDAERR
jgi:fatty acid desaturase